MEITKFGNPLLREQARPLSPEAILSPSTQTLIKNLYSVLEEGDYGVGLSAPQVGENKALFVVNLKPTPTLPDLEPYKAVFINPTIVETFDKKVNMWEGCVSAGEGENTLCAKVPRPNKIRLQWQDESGGSHDELFEGFIAHSLQHEVDHLNGILFVDRVEDTKTYMLVDEFKKFKEREELKNASSN